MTILRALALSLSIVLCWAVPAFGGSTVIQCAAPDGYTARYSGDWLLGEGPGELTTGPDTYSGVNPVYIFDDSDAGKAKIIWGGTVPEGMTRQQVESLNPTQAKTGTVVYSNANQTTLVELAENGLRVHSFYPQWQLGIFTRQTNGLVDRSALGSVFVATCTFTRIE